MENLLSSLWWSEKEIQVYLYLIEYGTSGASEIARHLSIPKSTANFTADALWKQGLLRKSFSGNTGMYTADPDLLQTSIETTISTHRSLLETVIPALREKSRHTISKPKIKLLDGREACRQAYLELLREREGFLEFWAHEDLERSFGEEWMQDFIRRRVEKWIFCDAIASSGDREIELQSHDREESRRIEMFPSEIGPIRSSIAITRDIVLILNLENERTPSGVRIENIHFADTIRTIFQLCKRGM